MQSDHDFQQALHRLDVEFGPKDVETLLPYTPGRTFIVKLLGMTEEQARAVLTRAREVGVDFQYQSKKYT